MNLEEKFKEITDEIPEKNPNLATTIYNKSQQQKSKRNPIFNKLTLSILGIAIVILVCILGPITYQSIKQRKIDSTIRLLRSVDEPSGGMAPLDTYKEFNEKLSDFSARITECHFQTTKENTVLSPASIFSALALAAECGSQEPKDNILQALGMEYSLMSENYPYFYQLLNRAGKDTTSTKSKLTNSIWIENDHSYKENCLERLATNYYSYTHYADFTKKDDLSKALKKFISEQTNGFLAPEITLSEETIFLILNTLYLKDSWNRDASDLSFTDQTFLFQNASLENKKLKLLKGNYKLGKAYETEHYRQFYTSTQNYKIYFIVPKGKKTIEEVMTADLIKGLTHTVYEKTNEEETELYYTRCLFPEFEVESSFSLTSSLKELGITKIFENGSQLETLSDDPLRCSNVQHIAKLQVNKKGIEGAAATLIEGAPGAPGPNEIKELYFDFIVDQSFGFVVMNFQGTQLFNGIIYNL